MCSGDEEDLLQCPRIDESGVESMVVGVTDCDHMEDAGVRCDGK